jgi:hypothetical protein
VPQLGAVGENACSHVGGIVASKGKAIIHAVLGMEYDRHDSVVWNVDGSHCGTVMSTTSTVSPLNSLKRFVTGFQELESEQARSAVPRQSRGPATIRETRHTSSRIVHISKIPGVPRGQLGG